MARRKVGAKKGRKCIKFGRSKGRRVCRKFSGAKRKVRRKKR